MLMALCYFFIASHHILPGISPQDSHIPTNQSKPSAVNRAAASLALEVAVLSVSQEQR